LLNLPRLLPRYIKLKKHLFVCILYAGFAGITRRRPHWMV
jgi:hypothetical protein